IAADRPIAGLRGEPVAALPRPTVGPEDMCLDVVREEIFGIARIGIVDRALGGFKIADFLMRESPDRLETFVTRQFGRPPGRDPVGLLQDRLGLTVTKIRDVAVS